MKLCYPKGNTHREPDFIPEPRFRTLLNYATQKSVDEVCVGDNLLFECFDTDLFFLIKVEQKDGDSVFGLIKESIVNRDYPENTKQTIQLPKHRLIYTLNDTDYEKSLQPQHHEDAFLKLLGVIK